MAVCCYVKLIFIFLLPFLCAHWLTVSCSFYEATPTQGVHGLCRYGTSGLYKPVPVLEWEPGCAEDTMQGMAFFLPPSLPPSLPLSLPHQGGPCQPNRIDAERELAKYSRTQFSLAELKAQPTPEGVDPSKLETYLSDSDFLVKQADRWTDRQTLSIEGWTAVARNGIIHVSARFLLQVCSGYCSLTLYT